MTSRLVSLLLCFLALAATLAAQTARWEPNGGTLGVGQPSELSLVFEQCEPKGDPTLPSIPGLSLRITGRSQSISMVNFSMSKTVTLSLVARLTERKAIDIPAFDIETDQGKIRVAAAHFEPGEATVGRNDITVDSHFTVPADTVWAGQVFPLTYTLSVTRRYFHSLGAAPTPQGESHMTLTAVYPTDANTSLQAAIRDKLADKIKTGFVELIPQEAFNGLLDAAVDEFLRGPRKHRFRTQHQYLSKDDARNTTGEPGYCTFEEPFTDPNYNVFADKNTLPGMIYLELVAIAQKAVPEGIAKDERFQQTWDADVQTMVVPILDKIVQDNAQAFMRAMIGGIVQHTMVQSINNMRNGNNMAPYCPPPPGF
jgi:hypothetical protein